MRNRITMKWAFPVTLLAAFAVLATAEPSAASNGSPEPHPNSYLGVHIDQITPQTASQLKLGEASGALITYVDQDGPASKAGLKNNDVVVGFNGSKVQSPDQLSDLIHATAAGKTVKLTVVREGQKKDINVTLGAWPNAMAHMHNLPPGSAMAFVAPSIKVPDIDVPSFTTLASRHGVVVESLCPQLADYFGVPHGQGVLVRSVEKGSPAEAAGLKAGDVITKVNNEAVHDMADWRRAMHVRSGKIQVSVVRDKHEQTVVLNLPASSDTSRLQEQDWQGFEDQMQALQQEMEALGPEIARSQTEMLATIKPSEQELEQMHQDVERSMKLSHGDLAKMQQEIQKSVPSLEELQKMRINIQAAMPSQQELDQIRRQVDESMKNWTPQLQQQMEQLKKQMEEQKLNLNEMLKGLESEPEF